MSSFCRLTNPGEVVYAVDRPYGVIEAAGQRAGNQPADAARVGVASFC